MKTAIYMTATVDVSDFHDMHTFSAVNLKGGIVCWVTFDNIHLLGNACGRLGKAGIRHMAPGFLAQGLAWIKQKWEGA